MTDKILKNIVQAVQNDIRRLAQKYNYKDFSFWNYLDYHQQEPIDKESCACVLTFDGGMLNAFDGYANNKFQDELNSIVDKAGFFYEFQKRAVLHIYSKNKELDQQYQNLLEWQWVTHLIQPEYSSLYNELFGFFATNPEKFLSLKPRQLELYVGEVLRNQGFEVEMGPGSNDGGIDLKLYQKNDIDQITTLVQVKKYKKTLPIRLEAVAALYGHVEAQKAQQGLFITTSRYLPVAKRFADRLCQKITLSDTTDLVNWSLNAKTAIIKDKSKLITDNYLIQLVNQVNEGKKKDVILVHHVSSGLIQCKYALILKETKYAALLILLPKKVVSTVAPHITIGGMRCQF